jgi:spore coat polysaccharide biosynthesis predicted glycosyltransferase SpsG
MLLFVVEASPELGFGHLVRCLNLARLNKRSGQPFFVINQNKAACALLTANKVPYTHKLNLSKISPLPKIAVFDLATLTQEHLLMREQIRLQEILCVQITDLRLNLLPDTTIIDGSVCLDMDPNHSFYHGPEYMMLHHKIRHFNRLERHYKKTIRNIFLSLGGGASYRQLRQFIDFFHRYRFTCRIAAGFLMKKNQKKILSRIYPGIRWVGETESLARAMYEADLAVIAPGVTAYEAAGTGTPALYFSHHALQEKTAAALTAKQVGLAMGLIADFTDHSLLEQLTTLSLEKRQMMGIEGKKLVDGLGLYRVNKIIHSVVSSKAK